jgi:hypothetical protein
VALRAPRKAAAQQARLDAMLGQLEALEEAPLATPAQQAQAIRLLAGAARRLILAAQRRGP